MRSPFKTCVTCHRPDVTARHRASGDTRCSACWLDFTSGDPESPAIVEVIAITEAQRLAPRRQSIPQDNLGARWTF